MLHNFFVYLQPERLMHKYIKHGTEQDEQEN